MPLQGHLPRARADDEGVHASGDRDRRQVARRVRPELLPLRRPDASQSCQEAAEDRTVAQQIRGTELVADLARLQEGPHQGHILGWVKVGSRSGRIDRRRSPTYAVT